MKPLEKVVIIAAVVAGILAIVLVLTFTLAPGAGKTERALEPYRAPREAEGLATSVAGSVFVYRASRSGASSASQWKPVEIGELLKADDYLKTFENSYCDVQIGGRVVFAVLENTAVKLASVFHSARGVKSETELLFGTLLCKAQKLAGDETVRVRANGTAFGVRGTEFLVERRGGRTVVAVKEGRVAVGAVAAGGAAETTVARGQELAIDDATGRPGRAAGVSGPRRALLDRLADVALLDTDPSREAELVKVGITVEPAAAEILLSGKTVGFGSFAGLFAPGVPIPVTLRKNGYKEDAFTITPKRGDNRTYSFRLDLDAPEKPVSTPGPNEAYELRIRQLQDEARKAAAENETLKADVEALRRDKADLGKRLDEANRKIKDALDKLK